MTHKVFKFVERFNASLSVSQAYNREKGSHWWALLTWIPEGYKEAVQQEGYGAFPEEALDDLCKLIDC